MDGILHNRVCVITGAGGISSAAAESAARAGASVFVISLDERECAALMAALQREGATCAYAIADLTNEAAVQMAVDQAQSRFGRIDALFNVAGISGRRFGDGPAHECSINGWETTLDVNLKSVFLMSRAVLNVMRAQSPQANGLRGSMVNTASVLAFSPRADYFATHAYAASKGAILSFTQAMAAHYAPQKIRINAIAPGLVRTPMSLRAQQDPRILEVLKTKQPLTEGFIDPADIAAAAIFLLSDQAQSITGQTLSVDAGWCVSG